MKNFILSREQTIFLKGIAITLMIFHHIYGMGALYVNDKNIFIDKEWENVINYFMGFAVVPLYAFITGYTYYLHKDKTWKYSIRKVFKFLINYWVIYGFFLCIALFYGHKFINTFNTLELIALKQQVLFFTWYVYFYIIIMLTMPFYKNIFKNNRQWDFIISIIIIITCILIKVIIMKVYYENEWLLMIAHMMGFYPAVIWGYIFSKYSILNLLYKFVLSNKFKELYIGLFLIIIINLFYIICSYNNLKIGSLGFLFVPIYILSMHLINIYKIYIFNKMFIFLGLYSVNIWFIHGAFFSPILKENIQYLIFIFGANYFTFIWFLLLCTCISIIMKFIQEKVIFFFYKR